MFRVTNKSAKRADGFFILLPDGRRSRFSGLESRILGRSVFFANESRIRAAGCTVEELSPVPVPAPAPVSIEEAPASPVETVVVVEAPTSVEVVSPLVEEVVVDSSADTSEPTDEPSSPEPEAAADTDVTAEERTPRKRRSRTAE
jgi:hypothetical protein